MQRRKFVQLGTASLLAGSGTFVSCHQTATGTDKRILEFTTPLCDLLGIRFPIIQAGMAEVAGPELVAAISNAGGLGILAATLVSPQVVKENIKQIRALTDKPFAVNLILHQDFLPPREFSISDETVQTIQGVLNGFRRVLGIPASNLKPPRLPSLIQSALEVILEERVPIFSIGLGNPSKEIVSQCRERGIKVMAMISTVEDALAVADNGVDVIVAQGSEAGGHRSTWEKKSSKDFANIGTLALTSAVVEKVKVPVVAAGGIVNGKGLKAALALGAQGVLMGTRFIASKESMASETYKQKILNSSSDDTILTDAFTGLFARVIRNQFSSDYAKANIPVFPPGRQYGATVDIVKAAKQQENPEYFALYAGQGIDEINDILPAEEIINRIMSEVVEN